jgi:WD40 repeat protein
VWAVAVTPDGQWAISGSDDKTLRAWDLEHTILWAMLHRERFTCFVIDQEETFNKVWVTADGQRLISGSPRGALKVWDLSPGLDEPELLCTISGSYSAWGDSVAVSPDGSRAVSASGNWLKVWDLHGGEELHTLKGHAHKVSAVALTPDKGRAISGADDGTLKVWDLHSGGELHSLAGHERRINTVMAAPDGWRAISIARDWTLKVWDLQSGGLLAAFTGEDELTAGAFAPDGATVVVGEASGRVHLLRLEGFEGRGAQGPSALGGLGKR